VALVADTTCAGFKTDCHTDSYLDFTADGGATWSRP
jgi:hypothetical protein